MGVEEHQSSPACEGKKVLVARLSHRQGGLAPEWYQSKAVEVLFVQVAEGSRYIMPPRRERQSPDREDRDARRRGRPAGNAEIER